MSKAVEPLNGQDAIPTEELIMGLRRKPPNLPCDSAVHCFDRMRRNERVSAETPLPQRQQCQSGYFNAAPEVFSVLLGKSSVTVTK